MRSSSGEDGVQTDITLFFT